MGTRRSFVQKVEEGVVKVATLGDMGDTATENVVKALAELSSVARTSPQVSEVNLFVSGKKRGLDVSIANPSQVKRAKGMVKKTDKPEEETMVGKVRRRQK